MGALEFSARTERMIETFEGSWTFDIAIRNYLPVYLIGQARMRLLVELIAIDMDRRANLGVDSYVDRYLEEFPALGEDAIATLQEHRDELRSLQSQSRPDIRAQTGLSEFAHFRSLTKVGEGGMGVVFRAVDCSLDRVVALKLMPGGVLNRDQFHREAEAVSRLKHPNIVRVFESGELDGTRYLAMEFVNGRSLRDTIRSGEPLDYRTAAAYMRTVAGAVQYAHEQHVLHRDLSPGNIMIDENNNAQVIDFGLAKLTDLPLGGTRTGAWMGTDGFTAPEQMQNAKGASPQSDVYSLGAILFYLLTGSVPEPGERPGGPIPGDLKTICRRCLETEPRKRYRSAAALEVALQRFLEHRTIAKTGCIRQFAMHIEHTLHRAQRWLLPGPGRVPKSSSSR